MRYHTSGDITTCCAPRGGCGAVLRQDQADCIGVPEAGPFKPDHYRY